VELTIGFVSVCTVVTEKFVSLIFKSICMYVYMYVCKQRTHMFHISIDTGLRIRGMIFHSLRWPTACVHTSIGA